MGSAASVESSEGSGVVTREQCKEILGPNYDETAFDKIADGNGCITMKQLNEQVAAFQTKNKVSQKAQGGMSKKEQFRSTRNLNLAIAKDDKDLCKEMFGELYSDALFASIADEDGCISKEQMMIELAKLKASAAGGEEALSAAAASALFASRLVTGIAVSCEAKQLRGLLGRIALSENPADFERLAANNTASFALLIDYRGLHNLLQCADGWSIMLKLGWTEDRLRSQLSNAKLFKLVVFPESSLSPIPAAATWDAIFALSVESFPSVASRLQAHADQIKATNEDPLPAAELLSLEQYEAVEDTLLNARLFLRSQFGLEDRFRGDGVLPDGAQELVTKNIALSSIKDLQIIDIPVAAPK